MSALKVGDSFPEGVSFTYIPVTPESSEITACGLPQKYDASAGKFPNCTPKGFAVWAALANTIGETEFQNKKVVIVAVPGAFTPTCQANHLPGYIQKLKDLKSKGVDQVVVIAYNDCFVMSAWGKANGVTDDSIVSSKAPAVPSRLILFADAV